MPPPLSIEVQIGARSLRVKNETQGLQIVKYPRKYRKGIRSLELTDRHSQLLISFAAEKKSVCKMFYWLKSIIVQLYGSFYTE